jgi:hypothetical protein
LTESDIANEFIRLISPAEALKEDFDQVRYLASALSSSPIGTPLLFIVDNFETVCNPAELFTWLDTYIRLPNKVLITTRFRDFKGDYPVDVFGMTESESLTGEYKGEVIRESDGHPYVIKILLGEVAKAGALVAIRRVVGSPVRFVPVFQFTCKKRQHICLPFQTVAES